MTKNKKILIIEDDHELRNVLRSALHDKNLTILEAGDGESGLAIALSEHPDLILLDIILPKIDGITMLKKLRADAWGKSAQVIILTNLTDTEKVDMAVVEGVRDYLVKTNWSLNDLLEKVKSKLEGGIQL